MSVVNEISYNEIICPNCHMELNSIPEHERNEFFVKCDCSTLFRVIEEDVKKYTTSVINES